MSRPDAPWFGTGSQPFAVEALLDTYEGPGWVRRELRGRSGWLKVSTARMVTPFSSWTTTIIAGVTDDGVHLPKTISNAFFQMACAGPLETHDYPPDIELDGQTEILFDGFRGGCDLRHLRLLREHEQELDDNILAEEARGEHVLAEVDSMLASLKRERRDPLTAPDRVEQLNRKIELIEEKQQAAEDWLIRRLRSMRLQSEALESDVIEALENPGELEELYSVRWVARDWRDVVTISSRTQDVFLGPQPGLLPRPAVPVGRHQHLKGKSWGAGAYATLIAQECYNLWKIAQEEREENERKERRWRETAIAAVRRTSDKDDRWAARRAALAAVEDARTRVKRERREARLAARLAAMQGDGSMPATVPDPAGGSNWRRDEAGLLAALAEWQAEKAARRAGLASPPPGAGHSLPARPTTLTEAASAELLDQPHSVYSDDQRAQSPVVADLATPAPLDVPSDTGGTAHEEHGSIDAIAAMIDRELMGMLKDLVR